MAIKDNIIYKNMGGGVLQEAGGGRTEGKAENSYFRRIMVYFLGGVLYWCTFLASHVHMFTVYGKSKPAEAYLIQSKYFQTSLFSHKLLL